MSSVDREAFLNGLYQELEKQAFVQALIPAAIGGATALGGQAASGLKSLVTPAEKPKPQVKPMPVIKPLPSLNVR